jgi:hypothetical protein
MDAPRRIKAVDYDVIGWGSVAGSEIDARSVDLRHRGALLLRPADMLTAYWRCVQSGVRFLAPRDREIQASSRAESDQSGSYPAAVK